MIKIVIFDLDGVLIDTRNMHFEIFNQALKEISGFTITKKEHLSIYDALPTMKKLELLNKEKKLPLSLNKKIWQRKQELTSEYLNNEIIEDENLKFIFSNLKNRGLKIYVASNSIKKTIEISIEKLGLKNYIDGFLSNEDVLSPKPHPEIYMKCIIKEKVLPSETLILEDSFYGRTAAILSGSHLCPIKDKTDVTLEKILKYLNIENKDLKWSDEKMNILIPMAGAGSRFSNSGFTFPKPLIEVDGKPMIQLVVENLNINANYIFLVRKEHYEKFNLKSFLNVIAPNCKIIIVNELTEGACCTTLLAEEFINNDNPLLICNSDQLIEWSSGQFYHSINTSDIDGSILTFENTHPKWSYIKSDDFSNVLEVKEKEVISNKATVGIYFWKKGSDYVKYANKMIVKNIRVNNEFYVAPVYNEAINDGKIVKYFNVEKMWGLGTPEDLNYFIKNKI